jgi:hypothetical protein
VHELVRHAGCERAVDDELGKPLADELFGVHSAVSGPLSHGPLLPF